MAHILGCFAILSSSESCFVRTLCYGPSVLDWPYMAFLLASLIYAVLFNMTRQCSVKEI